MMNSFSNTVKLVNGTWDSNNFEYNKLEVVAELCQTLPFLPDFPVAFTKLSTAVLLSAVTRIGKSTRPYLSETK